MLKILSQTMQWWDRPRWTSACLSTLCLVSNCFPHVRHEYFPSSVLPTMGLIRALISTSKILQLTIYSNVYTEFLVETSIILFHSPGRYNLRRMVSGIVSGQSISGFADFVAGNASVWNVQMNLGMALGILPIGKCPVAVEANVVPTMAFLYHGLHYCIEV